MELFEPRAFGVDLTDVPWLGLIIEHKTGISYQNQVGGHACNQRALEGFYVPLEPAFLTEDTPDRFKSATFKREAYSGYALDYQRAMEIIFGKYGGHCYSGIDNETADAIDELLNLRRGSVGKFVKVDRDRLAESMEAWVWMAPVEPLLSSLPGPIFSAMSHVSLKGVLTWANSD